MKRTVVATFVLAGVAIAAAGQWPASANAAQSPTSAFFAAVNSGDRAKHPSGMCGFPMAKASASVGKALLDHRTALMGDAIAQVLA